MNNVLLLGAGLVAQPVVDYLLQDKDIHLTVADVNLEAAQRVLKENPRGTAKQLDIHDVKALNELVTGAEVVISLVPFVFHPLVARACLDAGKHMVNASYVSQEMQALDAEAREKGILLLCECGLDPGLDHMAAMKMIHAIQREGGTVTEFYSYCGGLPAPEASDNPFRYKFSWSPKGVLLAILNGARYLENGREVSYSSEELFQAVRSFEVEGMAFEAYPNRDSVPYRERYGLQGIRNLFRGTLRYRGWTELMDALKKLSFLDQTPLPFQSPFAPSELTAHRLGVSQEEIETTLAERMPDPPGERGVEAFKWLGLLDETPRSWQGNTAMDCLVELMQEKMSYRQGERDMVVLHHQVTAEFGSETRRYHATLLDFGNSQGTAMARTVSLPTGIVARLLLDGKIDLAGVEIPVHAQIYEPVLAEMQRLGVSFKEEII